MTTDERLECLYRARGIVEKQAHRALAGEAPPACLEFLAEAGERIERLIAAKEEGELLMFHECNDPTDTANAPHFHVTRHDGSDEVIVLLRP